MTYTAHKGRTDKSGAMFFGPKELAEPPTDMGDIITELLDNALVKKREAEYAAGRGAGGGEVARKRIGAGYIGLECARQLAFKYHKETVMRSKEGVVSPGALNRHGEVGHWAESAVAEWLRLAGFNLQTCRMDDWGNEMPDRQVGFYAARDPETGQARIAGEIDGVILDVPEALRDYIPTPCIWEGKKATAKKFKRFKSLGLKAADAKYYGQVQTCMAYTDVKYALFSMLNLDNMEFYWELVPFNKSDAQALTDRAVRVLQSQSPRELPRITTDPSDFRCKFCDYQKSCWQEPEKAQTPSPAWITK